MKEQGLKWLRTHDLISNKQRNRIYEKVQHQKAYVESRKDASFVLSETSSEMDGSAKKKKWKREKKSETNSSRWMDISLYGGISKNYEHRDSNDTFLKASKAWEKKRAFFFPSVKTNSSHTHVMRELLLTRKCAFLSKTEESFFFLWFAAPS